MIINSLRHPSFEDYIQDLRDEAALRNDGRAVLEIAADRGYEALARALLERKLYSPWDRKSALEYATENGHNATVKLLLKKVSKSWYQTALNGAAANGQEATVKLLLKKGAKARRETEGGWTALHSAAWGGHEAIVKLLIKRGADPRAKTRPRQSTLHTALYRGWIEVVKTLLSLGANPLSLDLYGRTCMDWASLHKTTFDIMSQYCNDYSPTDQAIHSRVLHESIVTIATGLRTSQETELYHELGHCLILASNIQDAETAFEQRITEHLDKLNPVHLALCDMCLTDNISGKRFVCCTCGDIDLCSACMEKYKTGVPTRTCESHSFLKIPGGDWRALSHPQVNKMRESRDRWLERLIRTYSV